MKYRIRNTQTGELAPLTVYYATPKNGVNDIYHTPRPGMKVEMCTGIVDCEGTDVYEGDCVHVCEKTGKRWVIEYGSRGDAQFYVVDHINSCREINCEYDQVTFSIDGLEEIPLHVTI